VELKAEVFASFRNPESYGGTNVEGWKMAFIAVPTPKLNAAAPIPISAISTPLLKKLLCVKNDLTPPTPNKTILATITEAKNAWLTPNRKYGIRGTNPEKKYDIHVIAAPLRMPD
jgi:hypothetical protein